jgi:predicted site-specific integrase-resolvase
VSTAEGEVELLAPGEVAVLYGVCPPTVARWGKSGRLLPFLTPGGSRRYFGAEVRALLAGEGPEAARKLAVADRDRMAGGGR